MWVCLCGFGIGTDIEENINCLLQKYLCYKERLTFGEEKVVQNTGRKTAKRKTTLNG